jgi:hypothetical protein
MTKPGDGVNSEKYLELETVVRVSGADYLGSCCVQGKTRVLLNTTDKELG